MALNLKQQQLLRSRQTPSPASSPNFASTVQRPRRMTLTAVQAAAAQAPGLEQMQQQVTEWLRFDKDAASRAQVQAMLDKQAHTELKELMCQRLEFGE